MQRDTDTYVVTINKDIFYKNNNKGMIRTYVNFNRNQKM